MGQAPSTVLDRNNSASSRFCFLSSLGTISADSDDFIDDISRNWDYTAEIPDECLAYIFQFLGAADRKRCSLVCQRWLRVDGKNRHNLSLNAQSEILEWIPSIFTRFESVTKLALRCDRKSISLNDDALVLISTRCRNIRRVKLRGCREITDQGMVTFAQYCTSLRKLSCGSCMFGSKALNAVLDYCKNLEELSVKRLKGIQDGVSPIGPGAAASSLQSLCLKELINGQSFAPLLIASKKLKILKIIRCLGDWDEVLEMVGKRGGYYERNMYYDSSLMEIHLERLQVSNIGLTALSQCSTIENLHIVKIPECSNLGLVSVAKHCRVLKKLHVDGGRKNRIGDEGLIAVAKHCTDLQELVLVGVLATHLSLAAIASNCSKLERLALCGSGTFGDAEIACIAEKCVALKKLCIKGCPVSDIGIETLAWGCPNLVKLKVKKCKGVSGEIGDWLRERRKAVVINMDASDIDGVFDASGSDGGAHEVGVEFPQMVGHVSGADASTSFSGRLASFRKKFGHFSGRNLVACTFRRRTNSDDGSNSSL